ncbi:hypothetical protein [Pantoea ananatis]|uniref:hypothetical protein n=1 Tax=Pantoea ananas TaxID=553 RepID=UPI0007DAD9E3|nr:hypothetical protein [Pantoea ananatis]
MTISLSEIRQKIDNNQAKSKFNKDKANYVEENALLNVHRDGRTRSALTITFLVGFFLLLAGCFLFVLIYNSYAVDWIKDLNNQGLKESADKVTFLELDKVLAVIIGALGTSLGFIIGYYFKEKQH